MTSTDATQATAKALPEINRRRFLLNTASAGAAVAVAAPAHAAEPEMTPHDKAIWHMRELDRLAKEEGAHSTAVILIARKHCDGRIDHQTFMIDHSGKLHDECGILASKGGAA